MTVEGEDIKKLIDAVASLRTEVKNLKDEQRVVRTDVMALRLQASSVRGGWFVITVLSSIMLALGATVGWIWTNVR